MKVVPTAAEINSLKAFRSVAVHNIIVPITAEEFSAAVADIKSSECVGFDTESKPVFTKGEVNDGPHIAQFATENKCYIFQLWNPLSHNPLLYLLTDIAIKKIGFDLGSDKKLLLNKFGVSLRGCEDLCLDFKKLGYKGRMGVKTAVAIVLNEKFTKSKKISKSNWSKVRLDEGQLLYAANDALAALLVYLKLLNEI